LEGKPELIYFAESPSAVIAAKPLRMEAQPVRYFANITERGTIRYGQFGRAIGVLDSPNNHLLIGSAFDHAWTSSGIAVWRLHVGGVEMPGRWIVTDGEFVEFAEASE
jgi:hypothetical protein